MEALRAKKAKLQKAAEKQTTSQLTHDEQEALGLVPMLPDDGAVVPGGVVPKHRTEDKHAAASTDTVWNAKAAEVVVAVGGAYAPKKKVAPVVLPSLDDMMEEREKGPAKDSNATPSVQPPSSSAPAAYKPGAFKTVEKPRESPTNAGAPNFVEPTVVDKSAAPAAYKPGAYKSVDKPKESPTNAGAPKDVPQTALLSSDSPCAVQHSPPPTTVDSDKKNSKPLHVPDATPLAGSFKGVSSDAESATHKPGAYKPGAYKPGAFKAK